MVAKALAYCHSRGVYHGSLRSDTILLDATLCPKLAGFGRALMLQD
jgi:serine/threonine protein kinase